jgi:F-box/leucine-rich repeat protein 5
LRRLDLSGCAKITDKTLKKLSVALTPRVTNDRASSGGSGDEHSDCCQDELISVTHGLRYLSLSGCYQITDEGIR